MKRLFYVTNNLDDAELISDEVHKQGIDDHHFYVLSRDEKGIKTHHLHGSPRLDKTKILSAGQRAGLFSSVIVALAVLSFLLFTDIFEQLVIIPAISIVVLGVIALIILKITLGSFESYFMMLFNERLDSGEVVIVIDVAKEQSIQIEKIMDAHPKAKFIADSSNFFSPIPE